MPPKKKRATAVIRRQPSEDSSQAVAVSTDIEQSANMSELDSDLDNDFDPVQAATELKLAIEAQKKRRFAVRRRISAQYEAGVAAIARRAETALAEHEKRRIRLREDQLARLVAAVQRRDAAQRAMAQQLGRFYDGCVNTSQLLQTTYTGLAAEASAAGGVLTTAAENNTPSDWVPSTKREDNKSKSKSNPTLAVPGSRRKAGAVGGE